MIHVRRAWVGRAVIQNAVTIDVDEEIGRTDPRLHTYHEQLAIAAIFVDDLAVGTLDRYLGFERLAIL